MISLKNLYAIAKTKEYIGLYRNTPDTYFQLVKNSPFTNIKAKFESQQLAVYQLVVGGKFSCIYIDVLAVNSKRTQFNDILFSSIPPSQDRLWAYLKDRLTLEEMNSLTIEYIKEIVDVSNEPSPVSFIKTIKRFIGPLGVSNFAKLDKQQEEILKPFGGKTVCVKLYLELQKYERENMKKDVRIERIGGGVTVYISAY